MNKLRSIAGISALLFLGVGVASPLLAGTAMLSTNAERWGDAGSWVWQDTATGANDVDRIPGEGDMVIIASVSSERPAKIVIDSESAVSREILIGSHHQAAAPSELVITGGALLQTGQLVVGRGAEDVGMQGSGRLILDVGDVRVENAAHLGSLHGNSGSLEVREGTFRAAELHIGSSSLSDLIIGPRARVDVSGNAFFHSAANGGGSTLSFVIRDSEAGLLTVGRELALSNEPKIAITFDGPQTPTAGARFAIVRAEAHKGTFGGIEVSNLPKGLEAVGEWDGNVFSVSLIKK